MFLNIVINSLVFLGFLGGAQASYYSAPIIKLEALPEQLSFSADKAAVFSDYNRSFLFSKNAETVQAIASITKLMTAMVFLDHQPDWNSTYTITRDDIVSGGRINLFLGDEVTLRDLFNSSLIASDNGATLALVRAIGLNEEEFVLAMNHKARELGLMNTSFVDPIGLGENNLSTAKEVVKMFQAARQYEDINTAMALSEYSFKTIGGREKEIVSTDEYLLLDKNSDLLTLGGKTGYIDEAGYCFVGEFRDDRGRRFIAVVLNSDSKTSRFVESQELVTWLVNKYE